MIGISDLALPSSLRPVRIGDFGLVISDYFECLFCLLLPAFNPQSHPDYYRDRIPQ